MCRVGLGVGIGQGRVPAVVRYSKVMFRMRCRPRVRFRIRNRLSFRNRVKFRVRFRVRAKVSNRDRRNHIYVPNLVVALNMDTKAFIMDTELADV